MKRPHLIGRKAVGGRAHACAREAGFSLLEVLAVLVIIGLMSASVVLSMRPAAPPETSFRDDLILRLNQEAKAAIYTGQTRALSVSEDGLHIMVYRNNQWSITQDYPFVSGVTARLNIEDNKVEIPEDPVPLILFEPAGEITEFALNIRGFGDDIDLFNAPDGTVRIGTKS